MLKVNRVLFEELETERLLLRKIQEKDAKDLYQNIYNNFEWYKFCSQREFNSVYDYASTLVMYAYYYSKGNHFRWGIVEKETDKMIGEVVLYHIDEENKKCELGYILSYNHQKQGFATEAVSKIINFAFDKLNFHKIQSQIVSQNLPSLKLAKKLGMKYEGRSIESYRIDENYYDKDIFFMLNPMDKEKVMVK